MELPAVLTSAPGRVRAAELLIDGLSVFCFNQMGAEKFWEVAYPRLLQHQLQITIQQLDAAGHKVGFPQTVDVGNNVKSFNIRLTNGSREHYEQGHFPWGGPRREGFDRTVPSAPTDDPNDLGWMIDLASTELRHGTARLLPGHESRPISLARIHHSLFCTLGPEPREVRISPIFDGDPRSHNSVSLPFNNTEMVGVLLGTAPGNIVFESDPANALNINPLPYSLATRYEIEIKNTDLIRPPRVDPFVRGDLYRFYHVFIEVDGVQKDLWAQPRNPEVDPEGDCHSDFASFPTLETVIQP
jgi:hypothetical protein